MEKRLTIGMGDPRFKALLDQMWELHCRKTADYGIEGDYLANLRGAKGLGLTPLHGVALRMSDKMHRLGAYLCKGTLANEGVEDTLVDIAAYALLGTILFRETNKDKE